MEITRIEINNYRSIKDIQFDLDSISDKKCFIFVGINESGKSNILKAVGLLNPDSEYNYNKDCFRNLKYNDNIYVFFYLSFSESFYIDKIKKAVPEGVISDIKINGIRKYIVIDDTDEREDDFELQLEFKVNQEYVRDVNKNFKKISEIYNGQEIVTKDNIDILIPGFKLITKEGLETFILGKIRGILEANTPKCIYRKYSDKYIIGKEIPLNEFKNDPSISIPLKNIFCIAGIKENENIKKEIDIVEKDRDYRYSMCKKLSDSITKHIKDIWKEHKIEIEVKIEDSMNCRVIVKDIDDPENPFDMTERSEGFQHFISILLNLSAENSTDSLKNSIIILDEPEVHLHPSGVKFLRDELLKISKNNIVLIATHSIYMVDKDNLDRHFKVEKKNNITTIEKINKDNPLQEEVIYEALGTSILEHIEPNILLFEGKTDRDAFEFFTKKFKTVFKPINISCISADGVDNIHKYIKFFTNKLLRGFVLVDSDDDGIKEKKKVLENSNFNDKNTFEINDVLQTNKKSTLEDLLPKNMIIVCFKNMYKLDINIDDTRPIIEQIKKKLEEEKKFDKKDNLKKFKGYVVEEFIKDVSNRKNTLDTVKTKYSVFYDFMESIHKKLKRK